MDVDLKLVPEQDAILKDELSINVELASPGDFIPLPAGWEERSVLAEHGRRLSPRHFDPYSQALSKLERDHARDREDVRALLTSGLVDPRRLRAYSLKRERSPGIDRGRELDR